MLIRPGTCRSSLQLCSRRQQLACARLFHISHISRNSQAIPNHYDTLSLPTNASPGDIKKQFYKLSKSHHPDLHPNDPTASQKFVRISEAYAILGSPEKRARYDKDFLQSDVSSGSYGSQHRGSYSSASATGPGGRPASGLSRRRTQFRGPPPSFYRSGGWGEQGAKRSENANKASHTNEAQGRAASGPAGPGMGPGGFTVGMDNDVPHFDQRAHAQTHDDIERSRHRGRRKEQDSRFDDVDMAGGNSQLFNFFMISGILTVIIGVAGAFAGGPGVRTAPIKDKRKIQDG